LTTRRKRALDSPPEQGITYFPNITAVRLCKETKEHLYNVFNLLTIKWEYCPSLDEEKEIISFFSRFYNRYYIDYMNDVFRYERKFSVYRRPFDMRMFKTVLNAAAGLFSAGFRKKIRKILGERMSNTLYKTMRSG
jgi:hypothetical protein